MAPRNVAGHVVRGEDFWGRSDDVLALWDRLECDDVLLPGPRRMGKSSLMAALLDAPRPGWTVVYVDVYPVDKPEEFLIELTTALLAKAPIRRLYAQIAGTPGRLATWVGRIAEEVGAGVPNVGDIKIKLRERLAAAGVWTEMAAELLATLDGLGGRILIIIDEFPSMIATMLQADQPTALRVLRWMRARRGPSGASSVRFLLGGSVNLLPLLEDIGQERHLNDLDRYELRPFSQKRAVEFVAAVLDAEQVVEAHGVPEALVAIADTGVPFFLQVFIRECLEEARHRQVLVRALDLRAVFNDRVLGPPGRARFSHYLSRLREAYGPDEPPARAVLWEVALGSQVSVAALDGTLERSGHRNGTAQRLLPRLQADHYLTRSVDDVSFTSGFLREWWLRNAPGGPR